MAENKTTTVILSVEKKLIPSFSSLLGQGFGINVQVGCSVRELLCQQLGITADYLDTRIQTIFLNGKSVDDVDTAVIKEGSVLALSAAMPGLVGAVLRRGGNLAPMRSQISHPIDQKAAHKKEEMIVLKLFNLLVRELGPNFLQKGIRLKGNEFKDFLNRQSDIFFKEILDVKINGENVDVDRLDKTEWEGLDVYLQLVIKRD